MMFGLHGPEILIIFAVYGAYLIIPVLIIVALILLIRHFLREEKVSRDPKRVAERKSLAQVITEHRTERHMTQEFVANELGISRQAVSKWESGASEPSTTNLLALAKLFEVDPAEMLREVEA